MLDALMLALIVVAFAAAAGYARFCNQKRGQRSTASRKRVCR